MNKYPSPIEITSLMAIGFLAYTHYIGSAEGFMRLAYLLAFILLVLILAMRHYRRQLHDVRESRNQAVKYHDEVRKAYDFEAALSKNRLETIKMQAEEIRRKDHIMKQQHRRAQQTANRNRQGRR